MPETTDVMTVLATKKAGLRWLSLEIGRLLWTNACKALKTIQKALNVLENVKTMRKEFHLF